MKLPHLSPEQTAELVPAGTILAGYRGSRAHGTYIPPSDPLSADDIDVMSVFIPPLNHYIGIANMGKRDRGTKEKMLDTGNALWDSVAYEVRKYVYLLLKSNPNVLSLLWLPDNMYFHIHPLGQRLINARELFVTKQAYKSFIGYAYGQLKRMEHCQYHGRMGDKRRKLVERFGYDTKNATHLIRLLRMGVEFLTEGRLNVQRHDAKQLMEIKRGEWSLEKVKAEADKWFERAHEAYIKSPLRPQPDRDAAERLVVGIVRDFHGI